jgi:hypothetical protein
VTDAGRFDVSDAVEHFDRGWEQSAALRVQKKAPAVPVKELAPKQVFELTQRLARRCLGKSHARGSRGDRLFLTDCGEEFELTQRNSHIDGIE